MVRALSTQYVLRFNIAASRLSTQKSFVQRTPFKVMLLHMFT